jgi:hypothetical protein
MSDTAVHLVQEASPHELRQRQNAQLDAQVRPITARPSPSGAVHNSPALTVVFPLDIRASMHTLDCILDITLGSMNSYHSSLW